MSLPTQRRTSLKLTKFFVKRLSAFSGFLKCSLGAVARLEILERIQHSILAEIAFVGDDSLSPWHHYFQICFVGCIPAFLDDVLDTGRQWRREKAPRKIKASGVVQLHTQSRIQWEKTMISARASRHARAFLLILTCLLDVVLETTTRHDQT